MQNLDQIFHLSKDHWNCANIWAISFIFPKITWNCANIWTKSVIFPFTWTVPIYEQYLSSFQRSHDLCQYLDNIFPLSYSLSQSPQRMSRCPALHCLIVFLNHHKDCASVRALHCLVVFLNHHEDCPGVRAAAGWPTGHQLFLLAFYPLLGHKENSFH